MSKRTVLYFGLAAILVVAFVLTQFRILPDRRPPGTPRDILELAKRDDLNVIFLLVDTLRADRLGVYGYERPTSPAIDQLARTGIRFDRHHSQSSWTKTSMASIWTAMYPVRTGILRFDHALPDSAFLPAEMLREEGMLTAGIWRNGWVAPTFGFQQGFETYHRPSPGAPIGGKRRESDNPNARIAGSDIDATEGALEFLRANGKERFFLYVHYMDAHQYLSDEQSALFGTSYSDIYDNSIHWTDRHIATLVNALDEQGIRDRTILVIASDHGEAFQEHGSEGHAKDLYREVIHVPWIISLPFSLEDEIVVKSISENVDIWPTIFGLLGVAEVGDADGRSRLPEILAEAGVAEYPAPASSSPLFAHLDRTWGRSGKDSDPLVAVTLPTRRFIRSFGKRDERSLFATDEDPLEQVDLLDADPEADSSEYEALISEYLSSPGASWRDDVENVELDDMQKGQLRAIGYAID